MFCVENYAFKKSSYHTFSPYFGSSIKTNLKHEKFFLALCHGHAIGTSL